MEGLVPHGRAESTRLMAAHSRLLQCGRDDRLGQDRVTHNLLIQDQALDRGAPKPFLKVLNSASRNKESS